jgi:poly-gamma-glutamate capsule biosynthesis protein CapA/YwtB (metallophosphatase superfamily)
MRRHVIRRTVVRSVSALILCCVVTVAALPVRAAHDVWKWSTPAGDAVELLIIGDIQVQRRADPTTAFAHVRDTLLEADLVYANLEGMLVPSKGPVGDVPDKKWVHPGPDGVKALTSIKIAAVGVANNVVWDEQNLLATMRLLDANGIAHAGGGKDIDEAHAPAIVERKGVKFGFLQYTARWYRQTVQMATATKPGVARIMSVDGVTIDAGDLARLKADVKKLRPLVDVVVVSHHNRDCATPVHFGDEQSSERAGGAHADRSKAEAYQRLFAHTALDSGADLVFGHGTHTIQGTEVYKGKPILYAVGHSAFDQPGYEDSKDGMVVRVLVRGKKIVRVSFVPVTRDATNTMIMVSPSSGEGARLTGIVKRNSPGLRLAVDGQEVVVLGQAMGATSQR